MPRSTPDPHKRLREPTVSPKVRAAKKPVEKRPRTSQQPEKWVEVPLEEEEIKAGVEENRAATKGPL